MMACKRMGAVGPRTNKELPSILKTVRGPACSRVTMYGSLKTLALDCKGADKKRCEARVVQDVSAAAWELD